MSEKVSSVAHAEDFDLARAALLEITHADTIGANVSSVDEGDGVATLYFETKLGGYPDWHWAVSFARVDGEKPTVLETELRPGETALLAPDWVPWVDRLAEYRAAQDAAGLDGGEAEGEPDIDDDDDDDDLDNGLLHGGDLDGVDIDDALEGIDSDGDSDDGDDSGSDDDTPTGGARVSKS